MKLGFDIDGVVANVAQTVIDGINKKYGLNHTVGILVYNSVSTGKYVEDEELNKKLDQFMRDEILDNHDAMLSLEPHEGAVEAINKLKRYHSIHFITARKCESKDVSIAWCKKHKIPLDSLHAIGTAGTGKSNKGMIGRSLNLDFYIDDHPKHLESMYKYKNRWRKGLGLFTRPWNADEPLDMSKFIRFNNWNEVVRHLGVHNR